ncbi:hypothetical protein [Sphingomonas bacterium]|uniref:hypothetical protein n=1 Tax=Sphingomonas bacterium TaxID=1895847 RepID=UPI002637CFED|nr:hypothetical protein [Sphingomonas bacterium]MDB5677588.1 hypothetical protein [Sphingomonas bacterium]
MSTPAIIGLGFGLAAMAAAIWKGFASFSGDGRRSGLENNWQNENYMDAEDGRPSAERRPNDSTAPGIYQ